jgi:hypothetical protein
MSRRTRGLTVHSVVLARVQRVQNVEETLKEFKRTRLVSRKVGGRTKWRGSWIGGELEGEWGQPCVDEGSDSSESCSSTSVWKLG